MYRLFLSACFTGVFLAVLAGCRPGSAKVAPAEPPILPVAQPIAANVTDYVDYTGRTNAKDSVTIQPRVTGYLVAMPFKEGDDVNADDVLFEVDPRPYKAQLDAAKAQVKQNLAGLDYAKATNERFKMLEKKDPGAVSPRELDQYKAQEEQAKASLDLVKANLEAAELNLKWTKVTSPIAGHISRYYLTIGNLVNQDVTQLTTVVSMEEMYVYFDMDEPTLLQIKRAINEGKVARPRASKETVPEFAASTFGLLALPLGRGPFLLSSALYPGRTGADVEVLMELQGESNFPHRGTLNFVDNQVNPGTGSISVRGVFKNPRPPGGTYLLVPGMFVRVRLPIGQPQPGLLVKDEYLSILAAAEQGRKKLYVLDADNKVQDRSVTLGSLQKDGLRVITQGLKKDDWVLTGGLQQIRPKMLIRPERWTMGSVNSPAMRIDDPGKASMEKGKKK
jgi:multidrug efflux system membrane fusion protein